jgi:ribose transport system substrate-binding protein
MTKFKTAGVTLATLMFVAACSAGATPAPPTPAPPTAAPATEAPATEAPMSEAPMSEAPTGMYTLGFSNPLGVGNGFREEQLCTAKAQALVSGEVSSGTWIHRNTDAAGQLADIRTLIAANPDAIIFNPLDPEALNPALEEAQAAGIKTVAIDAAVTDPNTYNLSNDQEAYGYIGAKWLFEKLGGEGTVWYTRGIIGHPADTARDVGVKRALAEYPNITLYPSDDGIGTNWDPATATQNTNDLISSGEYDNIDGIWTSGMDSQVVDAIQGAGKPFVPIVGADLRAFVEQLLHIDPKYDGLEGIAVYNPASVGGAGVTLALQLLNDETVQTSEGNTVLLPEPPAYANDTAEGMAKLQEIDVPELDPLWPVSWEIPGWTTYTFDEMKACKGPGE